MKAELLRCHLPSETFGGSSFLPIDSNSDGSAVRGTRSCVPPGRWAAKREHPTLQPHEYTFVASTGRELMLGTAWPRPYSGMPGADAPRGRPFPARRAVTDRSVGRWAAM